MNKIALVAPMRGGKDTFGDILVKRYGYTRLSFGDAVKEISEKLFPDECKSRASARRIWQGVGNSMRSLDEGVWISCLGRKINSLEKVNHLSEKIVITDVRYPNELIFLKSKGFKIVQIIVDREVILTRCRDGNPTFNEDLLNDDSELMAFNELVGDYYIYNNDSLDSYESKVIHFINELTNKGAVYDDHE